MEQHLFRRIHGDSLPRRLGLIMAELLHRQEMIHHLEPDPGRIAELSERVQDVRQQVLARAEEHYTGPAVDPRAQTMDRTWRLSSYLRGLLRQGRQFTAQDRAGFRIDLAVLKSPRWGAGSRRTWISTRRRSGWRRRSSSWSARSTGSIGPTNSPRRDVFLRIGEPIDLGPFRGALSPGCPGGTPWRRRTAPRRDPGPHRRHPDRTDGVGVRDTRRSTVTDAGTAGWIAGMRPGSAMIPVRHQLLLIFRCRKAWILEAKHRVRLHAATSLSSLIPAGENAFEFLLVPRLIGDLVFQAHLEADVPEGVRLPEPLVVVRDRLFLGRQCVLQHFLRLVGAVGRGSVVGSPPREAILSARN